MSWSPRIAALAEPDVVVDEINQAYAMLLSSQFQGFCRDLHSESADYFISTLSNNNLRTMFRDVLMQGRKLDRGNPSPSNIGSDFSRFGFLFWDEVRRLDLRNQARQYHLEELNKWRNAIAHQDFDPAKLGTSNLQLAMVRQWRNACHQLAVAFDTVMHSRIASIGILPWYEPAMSTAQRKPQFRVGDRVHIPFGPRTLVGRIVEDRGAIGVHGRRLYRVSIPQDPFEPRFVEFAEDELEKLLDEETIDAALDEEQVIEYLSNGGLMSILMAASGGNGQPRVWLCRDGLGNPTHTFDSERGLIGGQPVPFAARKDDKVFLPEVKRVRDLLLSFGLPMKAVERIISRVGTAT